MARASGHERNFRALGLVDCVVDGMRNTAANPRQERVRGVEEPAPTLGGKGNMILRHVPTGDRRRLTVEESGVLQDFPR
jgi:hypothetical protein